MSIPKILHFVWVGDQSLCPVDNIKTWAIHNPSWQIKVWNNDAYNNYPWRNKWAMEQMWRREKCGVADIMRYEILYNHGGFCIDADSICLRPLEDWLFQAESFAVWENELERPGLIAVGYMASVPKNEFFNAIIEDIAQDTSIGNEPAWSSTGPVRLTSNWKKLKYNNLTIWPSHFFIPKHHSQRTYNGPGYVFSDQEWSSTFNTYSKKK